MLGWVHLAYESYPGYNATTLSVPLMVPAAAAVMMFLYLSTSSGAGWLELVADYVPSAAKAAGIVVATAGILELAMVGAHWGKYPDVAAQTIEEARQFLVDGGCVENLRFGRSRRARNYTFDRQSCLNRQFRYLHAFVGALALTAGLGILAVNVLVTVAGRRAFPRT